jgi:myo-inositol-1(or 4)-monophosphatase
VYESSHIPAGPWREHLEAAVRAAEDAGRTQLQAFDKPHRVHFKGERDLVTEVDRASEEAIHGRLRRAFPSHDFLMEEKETPRTGSPYLWVVDPLDGTTNYTHGYPHFCCSIALLHEGKTVLGVVLDPVRKDLFIAVAGGGAYLNGRRIRTSQEDRLIRCLIGTGFPNEIRKARDKNLRRFARVLPEVRGVRRSGSAALDFCYLAAGRLDGYWVLTLSPWDSAAGVLLVEEAGGCVTDLEGSPPHLHTEAFVASNGRIQGELLSLLSGRAGPRTSRSSGRRK